MRFLSDNAVRLVVILTAVVYLGAQFAVLLLLTDTTTGAWIGFGVVALVVTALAVTAIVVFERTSEYRGPDWGAAAPPARRTGDGGRRRILVVADCPASELCAQAMKREFTEDTDVLIVAPVLVSPLHFAASDEDAAWREAEERVREIAERFRAMGVRARGEVGADNPLEAIHDALALFHADEIIVVTRPDDRLNWLEQGLIEHAGETTGLPVRHLVVETDVATT